MADEAERPAANKEDDAKDSAVSRDLDPDRRGAGVGISRESLSGKAIASAMDCRKARDRSRSARECTEDDASIFDADDRRTAGGAADNVYAEDARSPRTERGLGVD